MIIKKKRDIKYMKTMILNELLLLYLFEKKHDKRSYVKNGLYRDFLGFDLLFEQNFGMQQQWY